MINAYKQTSVNMAGAEGRRRWNSPTAIFGIEPNEPVVHEVVKNHLANCRQGTQSALTRAEVSGGGKKPWRQKGTGHARQGSTRAPQWTHGGIVFAPKPRDYSYAHQQARSRRLALKSVLSAKAASGDLRGGGRSGSGRHQDQEHPGSFLDAVEAPARPSVVTPEVNENRVSSPPGTSPVSPPPPPRSSACMTSSTPRSWSSTRKPWLSSRRCSHE